MRSLTIGVLWSRTNGSALSFPQSEIFKHLKRGIIFKPSSPFPLIKSHSSQLSIFENFNFFNFGNAVKFESFTFIPKNSSPRNFKFLIPSISIKITQFGQSFRKSFCRLVNFGIQLAFIASSALATHPSPSILRNPRRLLRWPNPSTPHVAVNLLTSTSTALMDLNVLVARNFLWVPNLGENRTRPK
ncbi:hypothetical protein ACJIZ3_025358 [Penstemon smallii]|uniref:Uncharacterized protein n=1 Tax=Penstemon smallii TaxID=265156 RepID=A0ABD3TUJ7_9LAMI